MWDGLKRIGPNLARLGQASDRFDHIWGDSIDRKTRFGRNREPRLGRCRPMLSKRRPMFGPKLARNQQHSGEVGHRHWGGVSAFEGRCFRPSRASVDICADVTPCGLQSQHCAVSGRSGRMRQRVCVGLQSLRSRVSWQRFGRQLVELGWRDETRLATAILGLLALEFSVFRRFP